jgi:glycosyltransferase involved in cell wall biosynthesis
MTMAGSKIPIGIVLNTFQGGGTEHQMTELIRRLDHSRFAVHVACFGDRGELRERVHRAPVTVTEFRLSGLARASTVERFSRFVRWCRRLDIRIVHACDFYGNVFAMPAATIARVPVRIASRRDVSLPDRTPAQDRLQRLSYRFAHRVVANSTAAAEQLVVEGVPRDRIVRIENGLELSQFCDTRAAASPTIMMVANLRAGKGHDVLLAAAARVVTRVPSARFRIVGDGPLRPALDEAVVRLGLTGHVEFLGHRTDVPELLQTAGAFVFPSLMEAAPNAVIEAMAAGLPIVASDAGGIPEVITHQRNGLLVPPGNVDALAEALLRVLADPALAARLARLARQDAMARFSFDRMVKAFEDLYVRELQSRATDLSARTEPSGGPAAA